MKETTEDIEWLTSLLETSALRGGEHLRSIMKQQYALSAPQVVDYLQGVRHLALATVTASGKPRVAPVDGLFYRSKFHFSSGGNSARMQHLRRRPTVSATHFAGDDIAFIVHGEALLMGRDHPEVGGVDELCREVYGSSAFEWGPEVVYARIEPSVMFTYCRDPDRVLGS